MAVKAAWLLWLRAAIDSWLLAAAAWIAWCMVLPNVSITLLIELPMSAMAELWPCC